MAEFVNASPAKRFFVDMLIRDIRLEDAILDLVDNAIDSLIRTKGIDIDGIVTSMADPQGLYQASGDVAHQIVISVQPKEFRIEDNCGGIEFEDAKEIVFRFGSQVKRENTSLSVYGIGMKRAVFKIGRLITVESKTLNSGFRVEINVDEFEQSDSWQFPIEPSDPATKQEDCGTTITIREVADGVLRHLKNPKFEDSLVESIGQTYSLFLNEFVNVWLNGRKVLPEIINVSRSNEVRPSLRTIDVEGVRVTMITALQGLDGDSKKWIGKTAGWYLICNGRVVVFADQTELTGWRRELPAFQPKHRGFIGIVLFMSSDPESLPWTTTKRGINSESPVFHEIRAGMMAAARPVLRFLDRQYAGVPVSAENSDDLKVTGKVVRESLRPLPASTLFGENQQSFSVSDRLRQEESDSPVSSREI